MNRPPRRGDETVLLPRTPAAADTAVLPRLTGQPPRPFAVRALRYTIPVAAGTTDAFVLAAWGGYQTWTWAAGVAAFALTVAAAVALVAGWWVP